MIRVGRDASSLTARLRTPFERQTTRPPSRGGHPSNVAPCGSPGSRDRGARATLDKQSTFEQYTMTSSSVRIARYHASGVSKWTELRTCLASKAQQLRATVGSWRWPPSPASALLAARGCSDHGRILPAAAPPFWRPLTLWPHPGGRLGRFLQLDALQRRRAPPKGPPNSGTAKVTSIPGHGLSDRPSTEHHRTRSRSRPGRGTRPCARHSEAFPVPRVPALARR